MIPRISVWSISVEIGGCGANSWELVPVNDRLPSKSKTGVMGCLFVEIALVKETLFKGVLAEKESEAVETPAPANDVSDIDNGKVAD